MRYGIYIFLLIASCTTAAAQMPLPAGAEQRYLPMRCCSDQESAVVGRVRCFMEDEQGFMWIGSENGLFRYDGMHLKPYYELMAGLEERAAFATAAMAPGPDGLIFAGSLTGEILQINTRTQELRLYTVPASQRGQNMVEFFDLAWEEGILWAGTQSGLLRLDPQQQRFRYYQPSAQGVVPANPVYSVRPDPQYPGRIWAGNRSCLLSFNTEREQFEAHFMKFDQLHLRSGQLFDQLQFPEQGPELWCNGYASGIKVYNTATGQWKELLSDAHLQDVMALDRLGKHWYGVHYDYGPAQLLPESRELRYFRDPASKQSRVAQPKYHSLYISSDGTIWAGSDAGFCRFRPQDQRVQHVFLPEREQESEFFFANAVQDMGHYYLVATSYGYGLYKWYKKGGRIEVLPNPIFEPTDTELDIFQACKRPDGSVDLFSRKGIWRYLPESERVVPVNLNIRAFWAEPCAGGYLVQTRPDELHFLRGYQIVRSLKFGSGKLPPVEHISDYEVQGGNVWAIANGILMRIDERDSLQLWRNTPGQEYFRQNHLRSLEVVGDTLVIGNRSAGFEIFRLQGTELKRLRSVGENLQKQRLQIHTSDRLGSTIYFASNQGLLIYDLHRGRLRIVDQEDGLLVQNLGKSWISRVTPIKPDEVIVSGHGFLTQVDAAAFVPEPLELGLSAVRQQEHNLPPGQYRNGLKLAHDQNYFELFYRVLPMRNSDKLHYRYRLNGYDNDWVDGQPGYLRYASVPPGTYQLQLQASADHRWRDYAELQLPIQVVPPFYQTIWFYLFCGLGALTFGGYLYRKRIKYIQQQEELKSDFNQRVAQLEMEALRAQMNPHFIFNALNSIEYYINEDNTEDAINYLQKFAALIRMTLQNSKQPYISLQEELASLKYYMEIEQMRLDGSFDFELDIAPELNAAAIQIPPLLLQPYVENAIWHGLLYLRGERGKLSIRCQWQGGRTEIRITDNGVGRQKSTELQRNRLQNRKSMGMIITRRRMQLNEAITGIQTDVAVEDLVSHTGESCGTRVIIYLRPKQMS